MPAPILQIKRGLKSNLPGLALGEPGFTTDTKDLYIGLDGTLENNVFISSRRYWRPESNVVGGGVNLYEGTDNGVNKIGLRAPNSVPGDVNYTFPPSPIENYFLKTNSVGDLEWSNEFINGEFSGTAQFTGNVETRGNISVYGDSSIFDTETFNVGSRLINVGLQTVSPSTSTWDLGVLFNYYKSGARYRSGVFWDDSSGRIGIASNVTTIVNEFGDGTTDPIIDTSSISWGSLEIKSLWINDCVGQSEVITCSNSERMLENISIDAGVY